jgi:hypothetical protein
MCDFVRHESWPRVRMGRCDICEVPRDLRGAIEIGHRGSVPPELFEVCGPCRSSVLNRAHRSIPDGALRSRLAEPGEERCRYLREAVDVVVRPPRLAV